MASLGVATFGFLTAAFFLRRATDGFLDTFGTIGRSPSDRSSIESYESSETLGSMGYDLSRIHPSTQKLFAIAMRYDTGRTYPSTQKVFCYFHGIWY